MKKRLTIFFILLAIVLLYFFIKSPFQSGVSEKGGTIVIGLSSDVDTFNPIFAESESAHEINHLMLLGLADLNERSEFVPELAESWQHSADYLTLTYNLRKDAVWSDGHPITAYDVKFTYNLLMDTLTASPRQGVTEFIKNVSVIDSFTISFEFKEAYPDQLFDTAGEILPRHILSDVDPGHIRSHKFGREPLSSGPYILKKWVNQQYIELIPNEKYFAARPNLNRVIFKIIPDKTSLLIQLETGEVDMMVGVPPAEVSRLQKSEKKINVYPVTGRNYYFLAYNNTNDLFGNPEIRRALTMAIDRNKMIRALLFGYGKPCLGPISPMLDWAYNNSIEEIPFDPDKAKMELENAGWKDHDGNGILDKNGRPFEFTILTSAGNQIKSDAAVIIQDQLKKIGIKVEIQTLEWTTLLKRLREKDFEAVVNGLSSSMYMDLTPIFHSASTNIFNFVQYKNPEVDRLIETGRVEMNRSKAGKDWKEAQKLIYADQPYTFLFWIDKVIAVNADFENVTPIPLSAFYNLEKWRRVSSPN